MKLYVRLHNAAAVTGLLRSINLSLWHIHSGGQISWSWPWSPGFINHNLMRQNTTHRAHRSIYISITARTRLMWPLMADVTDHTQQYYNTQWDLVANKQEMNTAFFVLMFGTRSCHISGKNCWAWCGDISCKLVRKLSHKYEDNKMNSAGAPKTMIRPQTCQDPEKLCLLFQQTFSMKSIVSWPLECNFSLLSALSSLWDWDRYCMKWCTLLWLCLTFIAFFFFSSPTPFFSQEAVLFFSHLASFHHSFSQDWRISTEAKACHTFADLHPEDDMIEMISRSISTHMAVLHSVPVLSSGISSNIECFHARSTSLCGYLHV